MNKVVGNKYNYTFTVFTPTYNRADTLHRVYQSLQSQTFKDFEWLIVDDGSSDGTVELVKKWQSECNFTVRYIYQENSGKHLAFNRGVEEADGQLFLTLDSDDACVENALEQLYDHWLKISPEERKYYSAVTALCRDQSGSLVGDQLPEDIIDSSTLEMRYRYKLTGERWGFHLTDILKNYPFPEMPKVKFFPEGVIWAEISKQYKTRYINQMLRIYWTQDGKIDHLSNLNESVALGRSIYHKHVLTRQLEWFRYAPLEFMKSAINYSRYSFYSGVKLADQIRGFGGFGMFLWCLMLPIGYALFLKKKQWH